MPYRLHRAQRHAAPARPDETTAHGRAAARRGARPQATDAAGSACAALADVAAESTTRVARLAQAARVDAVHQPGRSSRAASGRATPASRPARPTPPGARPPQLLDHEPPPGRRLQRNRQPRRIHRAEPAPQTSARGRHHPAGPQLTRYVIDQIEGDLVAMHIEPAYDRHLGLIELHVDSSIVTRPSRGCPCTHSCDLFRLQIARVGDSPLPLELIGRMQFRQQQLMQPLPRHQHAATPAAAATRSSRSQSRAPAANTTNRSPSATRTRSPAGRGDHRTASGPDTETGAAFSPTTARSAPTTPSGSSHRFALIDTLQR